MRYSQIVVATLASLAVSPTFAASICFSYQLSKAIPVAYPAGGSISMNWLITNLPKKSTAAVKITPGDYILQPGMQMIMGGGRGDVGINWSAASGSPDVAQVTACTFP